MDRYYANVEIQTSGYAAYIRYSKYHTVWSNYYVRWYDRTLCHACSVVFHVNHVSYQFSLALRDLGEDTKSGSAFLVMAIIGNACIPQFTAFVMNHNADFYQVAYIIPLICFFFTAYYGWKGYKIEKKHH